MAKFLITVKEITSLGVPYQIIITPESYPKTQFFDEKIDNKKQNPTVEMYSLSSIPTRFKHLRVSELNMTNINYEAPYISLTRHGLNNGYDIIKKHGKMLSSVKDWHLFQLNIGTEFSIYHRNSLQKRFHILDVHRTR